MMKIAIIGCGWLGLPLAEDLVSKGHSVLGTTRSPYKIQLLAARNIIPILYSGELTKELGSALSTADIVIITLPPGNRVTYIDQISEILSKIPSKSKVIYTSSIGIYADRNTSFREDGEVLTDHIVYKAEQIFMNDHPERTTILRLGGLIGNDRHPVKYLAGRTNLENGNAPINLVALEDVIGAILKVIDVHLYGYIFNIVNPEHPEKNEYYHEMANKLNLVAPEFVKGGAGGKKVDGSFISEKTDYSYKASIYSI